MRKSIFEIAKLKEYYIKQGQPDIKIEKVFKSCVCGICFKKLMEVYKPIKHKLFIKIDGSKVIKSYALSGNDKIIDLFKA